MFPITEAHAQEGVPAPPTGDPALTGAPGAAAPPGGGLISFLPLILIFAIMYFLLIRPQQKRMKEHQAMLAAVKKGDRVVVGGLIGTITKTIGDDELQVELAEGVRVKALRSGVAALHGTASKPKSAKDDEDDADDEDTASSGPSLSKG